jgi:3'(2'), 5'-bisphosphate nucleotidase
MLLFEEVGGKITDVNGLDINLAAGRKMTDNFGFVAAPKHLHSLVLHTLQELLKEQGKV